MICSVPSDNAKTTDDNSEPCFLRELASVQHAVEQENCPHAQAEYDRLGNAFIQQYDSLFRAVVSRTFPTTHRYHEDAVQFVYLKALQDAPKFRDSRFSNETDYHEQRAEVAYLNRLARNTTIQFNQRFHALKRAREVLSSDLDNDSREAVTPKAKSIEPADIVLANERFEFVQACLDELPPRSAEAVRLRYLEGRTVAEVGVQLNASEPATKGLLKRGLASLRRLAQEWLAEDEG